MNDHCDGRDMCVRPSLSLWSWKPAVVIDLKIFYIVIGRLRLGKTWIHYPFWSGGKYFLFRPGKFNRFQIREIFYSLSLWVQPSRHDQIDRVSTSHQWTHTETRQCFPSQFSLAPCVINLQVMSHSDPKQL